MLLRFFCKWLSLAMVPEKRRSQVLKGVFNSDLLVMTL